MPTQKPKSKAPTRNARLGRPPADAPPAVTIAVRVAPDEVKALDALVQEMSANGPRTTRSALVQHIIREALKARAATREAKS